MALNAIGCEIGARAILQADRFIGGGGERAEQMAIGDRIAEIACAPQGFELVRDAAVVILVAIELRGIEAEGETALRCMAGQTFRATGVMPYLRP